MYFVDSRRIPDTTLKSSLPLSPKVVPSYRAMSKLARSSGESCSEMSGHPSMVSSWDWLFCDGGCGSENMFLKKTECRERIDMWTLNMTFSAFSTTEPSENQSSGCRVYA